MNDDSLSAERLEDVSERRKGRFGRVARHFDSIGSTNTAAMDWALGGAPQGAVVTTDHQTAGRGRWGRSWSSSPGRLLQFSLVLRPRFPVGDAGLITTAAGVAVAEGIRKATGLETRVKWPNDVTIEGRKVSGMLVESELEGSEIAVAIVGIGINVNWARDDMPEDIRERATSLSAETGAELSRFDLLNHVLQTLEASYRMLRTAARRSDLIGRAKELSGVLGRDVTIRFADGSQIEGRAERLLPNGALEVTTEGRRRTVHVGEVERLR